MIQDIIFDVSEVLTKHVKGEDWSDRLLSEESKVPVETIRAFFTEYTKVGSKTHGMSLEDFWPQRTIDTATLTLSMVRAAAQRHEQDIVANTEMIQVLLNLTPHYRLFALTNTWKPGHLLKNHLEQYFVAFVQSCDINLRKPDPAVFRYMISTFNLKPEATLFIDNKKENIEGAQAVGMKAFQFISVDDLRKKLIEYKVNAL